MSLRHLIKYTALGRLVLIPFRFLFIALPRLLRQLGSMVAWAFASKEYYNFTYQLTAWNRAYLASYVAVVSGHKVSEIESYMRELEEDEGLRALLRERTLAS